MKDLNTIGDRKRVSRFDPDLAAKVVAEEERLERAAKLRQKLGKENPVPATEHAAEPATPPSSIAVAGEYILMSQTSTYALGMHALQEACQKKHNPNQPKITLPNGREVYRSNTFLENILARINDYETLQNPDGSVRTMDQRLTLFNTWLDSCCGIAYKAKTTKLKLNLTCPQLIGIAKDFAGKYLPVDYAHFPHQVELDSSSKTFIRDGWLALLEGKTDVYEHYLAVLKTIKGLDIIPNFGVRKNIAEDELRAVFVNSLDNFSFAIGFNNLFYYGRFLLKR